MRFSEFGDFALKFELYFWANDPGKRWYVMSELNFAIDEIFKKNHIKIALPQYDVHIHSLAPFKKESMPEYLNGKIDENK